MAVNKCVKFLLFFFNFLFWLSGCLILGISIYLKVNKNANQITNVSTNGVDLMIAIGSIIMFLGFLGCCGAIKESRCLLLIFFISLLVIFVLLLAAGILGAVQQPQVKDWVKQHLQQFIPLSNQPQQLQNDLEIIQKNLLCCGLVNGKSDWATPPSSCLCNSTQTVQCKSTYNETPCSEKIIQLLQNNLQIVLGVAFGIAVLLIFGMALSMVLYKQIGQKAGPTPA